MKASSGYEIYHNTLSSCLDEIEKYVQSKGYEVGDYFPELNHVSYGQTERTKLELLKGGKIANELSIQIYRMDNGRYELNCYPIRKFSNGGKVLWAVKKGSPAWEEQIITENEKDIDKAKNWAKENGFDRFRIQTIDLSTKPDFKKTFAKGGYTRPAFNIKTTGDYLFQTNKGNFNLKSYLFERQNDTEDSLEIQDELRGELGSIIIKNSAWKRLSSGSSVKARSEKGNFVGTLTRVESMPKYDIGGGVNLFQIGDFYLMKFDKITYEVLATKDHQVLLGIKGSKEWTKSNTRVVSISLFNKWIKTKKAIKKFATGGNVAQYKDLSKEQPLVVNDSGKFSVPEIDIKKTGVKTEYDFAKNKITKSLDSYEVFKSYWDKNNIELVEEMNVMFLNKMNKPIGIYQHTKGGIDGTILDVEVVCGLAVKSLCKGVIIAHNHPSGNLNPSEADIKVSKNLKNALNLFSITLLDSLIVTPDGYYSLADNGLIY
jgi:DNA repair protein RadC